MRLLAIETSTPGASVALVEDATTLAAASRIDPVGHATFLVPAIDFCFDQVGWSPSALDAVAVDIGPGLYTGIRVGVATAQGLAAAFGIPIIPAVSTDAIALGGTNRAPADMGGGRRPARRACRGSLPARSRRRGPGD